MHCSEDAAAEVDLVEMHLATKDQVVPNMKIRNRLKCFVHLRMLEAVDYQKWLGCTVMVCKDAQGIRLS